MRNTRSSRSKQKKHKRASLAALRADIDEFDPKYANVPLDVPIGHVEEYLHRKNHRNDQDHLQAQIICFKKEFGAVSAVHPAATSTTTTSTSSTTATSTSTTATTSNTASSSSSSSAAAASSSSASASSMSTTLPAFNMFNMHQIHRHRASAIVNNIMNHTQLMMQDEHSHTNDDHKDEHDHDHEHNDDDYNMAAFDDDLLLPSNDSISSIRSALARYEAWQYNSNNTNASEPQSHAHSHSHRRSAPRQAANRYPYPWAFYQCALQDHMDEDEQLASSCSSRHARSVPSNNEQSRKIAQHQRQQRRALRAQRDENQSQKRDRERDRNGYQYVTPFYNPFLRVNIVESKQAQHVAAATDECKTECSTKKHVRLSSRKQTVRDDDDDDKENVHEEESHSHSQSKRSQAAPAATKSIFPLSHYEQNRVRDTNVVVGEEEEPDYAGNHGVVVEREEEEDDLDEYHDYDMMADLNVLSNMNHATNTNANANTNAHSNSNSNANSKTNRPFRPNYNHFRQQQYRRYRAMQILQHQQQRSMQVFKLRRRLWRDVNLLNDYNRMSNHHSSNVHGGDMEENEQILHNIHNYDLNNEIDSTAFRLHAASFNLLPLPMSFQANDEELVLNLMNSQHGHDDGGGDNDHNHNSNSNENVNLNANRHSFNPMRFSSHLSRFSNVLSFNTAFSDDDNDNNNVKLKVVSPKLQQHISTRLDGLQDFKAAFELIALRLTCLDPFKQKIYPHRQYRRRQKQETDDTLTDEEDDEHELHRRRHHGYRVCTNNGNKTVVISGIDRQQNLLSQLSSDLHLILLTMLTGLDNVRTMALYRSLRSELTEFDISRIRNCSVYKCQALFVERYRQALFDEKYKALQAPALHRALSDAPQSLDEFQKHRETQLMKRQSSISSQSSVEFVHDNAALHVYGVDKQSI